MGVYEVEDMHMRGRESNYCTRENIFAREKLPLGETERRVRVALV